MRQTFETLVARQWDLHRRWDCTGGDCPALTERDDRLIRRYLDQCKGDFPAMANLRRLLTADAPGSVRQATDDEVIRQAAERLKSGQWHIKPPGAGSQANRESSAEAWALVPGTASGNPMARPSCKTRLGPRSRELEIVAAKDLQPGDVYWADPPLTYAAILVMAQEADERAALLELCGHVYGEWMAKSLGGDPGVLAQRIQTALRRGLIVLVRLEHLAGGGAEQTDAKPSDGPASKPAPAPPPPELPKKPEKTWFRMQLLNEEGSPMAGEDYEVVDSDGAKRKGKLDANGELYIPPVLTPGECSIKFPNIHLNPRKRK